MPSPGVMILMSDDNKETTSFIIESCTYYYRVMPFGLKNVGATYQCLVNKVFKHHISQNIEVYVDDILVKSARESGHIRDLKETFAILKEFRMKFNPQKCVFEVASRKFMGFMVANRGIEASLDKIKAMLDMQEPTTL